MDTDDVSTLDTYQNPTKTNYEKMVRHDEEIYLTECDEIMIEVRTCVGLEQAMSFGQEVEEALKERGSMTKTRHSSKQDDVRTENRINETVGI